LRKQLSVGDVDLTAKGNRKALSLPIEEYLPSLRQHESIVIRASHMRVTLAPPVASWHPHQRSVETILEVSVENAVFDENRSVRGGTLVVHVYGSAARRNRAIVNHSTELGSDPLTEPAAESGRLLAIEIAL
jgi:hypothetical protein